MKENPMHDKQCRIDYGWPECDKPHAERNSVSRESNPQWPNKFDEFYLAGFNAAIHSAANACKRLSESAAKQDDQHGWAWALACQSEIQKISPEECQE